MANLKNLNWPGELGPLGTGDMGLHNNLVLCLDANLQNQKGIAYCADWILNNDSNKRAIKGGNALNVQTVGAFTLKNIKQEDTPCEADMAFTEHIEMHI